MILTNPLCMLKETRGDLNASDIKETNLIIDRFQQGSMFPSPLNFCVFVTKILCSKLLNGVLVYQSKVFKV